MKNLIKTVLFFSSLAFIVGCSDDDDPNPGVMPTGNSKTFTLDTRAVPGITGAALFEENDDNSTTIKLTLNNTPAGGQHPAHIHFNTAAEGGGIALTLGTVNGDTGEGIITVSSLDDGTTISYDQLINYDGYINVHLSSSDLGTIVAQGDIGVNELSGDSKVYNLASVAVEGISGTATFEKRMSGEALATLEIANTPEGGEHPAHIHFNTAAEGGGIAFTFNPVNGDNGISRTNVAELDDGSAFVYDDILTYDGYINVHLSASELGTIVAQGDIGNNELTGDSKSYALNSVAVESISGTATFEKRVSGTALATLEISNTPEGGLHPAHIHFNTAAEGGGIAFTFNPVNGDNGISKTNVALLDDETAFNYDDILAYSGYINVHLSSEELGTIVAQGDIGINELTGESKSFALGSIAVESISGTATFEERVSGAALATLEISNTPEGGVHPAHIHFNTAAEGGGIAFTFNPVNGDNGISKTHVATLDDGSDFNYNDILNYDGYINVHLSAAELGTIVAQGDIGQNELTGASVVYNLNSVAVPAIDGTVTFFERDNGEALAVLEIANTPEGGVHPAHIHNNSAAEGGSIAFTFNPVDGSFGMSKTNVALLDDETAFGFNEVLGFNGYINVHLSAEELATIVAQGNIGSNVQ